jgi:hypothetical protein
MARVLPDADQLMLDVIRTAISGQSAGTFIPSDLANRLPYVTARRITGPPRHPQFAGNPTMDVQTWATTREVAADLAEDVRVAVYDAWRKQTTYASGWIAWQACISEPAELRSTLEAVPEDLYRFQATYRLVVRR